MSTQRARQGLDGRTLHRRLGKVGLLFTSMGCIIGSGWLLAPLYAAQVAGPAAVFSWLIGAVLIIFIALVYSELGPMFPYAGGIVRFPFYTHGQLTGFTAGWFSILHVMVLPALEVAAVLQYATNYLPWLSRKSGDVVVLTSSGYGVAVGLLAVFAFINVMGIGWFARANTLIVWWKLFVVVLTIVALVVTSFHASHFTQFGGFVPNGTDSVFSAMASAGIVFSLVGFRQAIELAGESRNPQRDVPFAVIGAVVLTTVLYIALQIAFVGAVPGNLVAKSGWERLTFANEFGPLAGIALLLGLGWLAIVLYIDAFVSPADTGLIYMTVSARVSYAIARTGNAPKGIMRITDRGVPWVAVIVSFVVSLIILVPYGGWRELVGFVTSATSLSLATGAVALLALRRQLPDQPRPFRLPAATFIAAIAFFAANLFVFWNGWDTNWRMFIAVGIGFVIFAVHYLTQRRGNRPTLNLKQFAWIPVWFAGLIVISALGTFGGGAGVISFLIGLPVMAVYSTLILAWAVTLRCPAEEARRHVTSSTGSEESQFAPTIS